MVMHMPFRQSSVWSVLSGGGIGTGCLCVTGSARSLAASLAEVEIFSRLSTRNLA